jgi:hypothetical protein
MSVPLTSRSPPDSKCELLLSRPQDGLLVVSRQNRQKAEDKSLFALFAPCRGEVFVLFPVDVSVCAVQVGR